jgi:hypothetical protein
MAYDPQGSTAAMNARGYADNPTGRAQMAAGQQPSGEGRWVPLTTGGNGVATASQLGSALDSLWGASASGSMQQFLESIRQFNLNFGNTMAGTYGQNWGPGVLAPQTASSLAAQQAGGMIGYIPGFSGLTTGQTQGELAQQASTAQGAAGLTGWYAAPSQSEWTPGTFVRLDPGTYDTSQYGDVQISYVLPSGQLQRVNIPQAKAMGWDGDLSKMPTTTAQHAIQLEGAPPQKLPQQTLEGLSAYSNLNTAAQNQALASAGVTGYYTAPSTIYAPGVDLNGGKFSDLPLETQNAYYMSNGSDWNAAMAKWVHDSNAAIQQFYTDRGLPPPNQAGQPQMTMAREQQTYNQQMGAINTAASLQANPFRQQQVIGQLGNVLGVGGHPAASFSAPNTVAGVGTAGGTGPNTGMAYMQQLIDDIRGGTNSANSQGVQGVLDAIPTPNKINSQDFLRSAPSTQNMILQGMQEKYGLDPNDSLTQIKNTLPSFQAPTTFGQVKG